MTDLTKDAAEECARELWTRLSIQPGTVTPDVLTPIIQRHMEKVAMAAYNEAKARDFGAEELHDLNNKLQALMLQRECLRDLSNHEEAYRFAHDQHGGGDMRTGRAWDRMRNAGDTARKLLGGGG